MTEQSDSWPKRFSLIDRAGLTFKAFLSGQYGSRFYREEFLDGVAARKVEVNARLGKLAGSCFVLTTILAFFDQLTGSITFSGVEIRVSQDLVPIVAFLTSASVLSAAMAFLDQLLIDRYIMTIGQQVGIHHFSTMLVDKIATNLWSDALVPKYFGERSRWGHKSAMIILSFVFLLMMLSLIAYPTFFVVKSVYDVYAAPTSKIANQFLSIASSIVLFSSIILIFCFSIRFKFDRANFNEHDLEPTPEFLAEIQSQISANDQN